MLKVVELVTRPNVFIDEHKAEYIQCLVVDEGEPYYIIVDMELGIAYRHYEIVRIL